MTDYFLALFGWQVQTVDGVIVWLHVSGTVIYNQGPHEG